MFGGVQAADWQIQRHQPDGAIAFDPLLPQVLPVRTVYGTVDSRGFARGVCPAARVAFHRAPPSSASPQICTGCRASFIHGGLGHCHPTVQDRRHVAASMNQ